jgi:hypothetical protein
MKKHVITTTQLRGMIKEALEESMQEIALDEQIAALKAKGSKRTLQETKQYRRLLEMKMEGMDELAMGEEEEVVTSELSPDVVRSLDVKRALETLENSPLIQKRLGKVDKRNEMIEFLAALTLEIAGGNKEMANEIFMLARSVMNKRAKEVKKEEEEVEEPLLGRQSTEEEAEILGMKKPVMESRRLVRRSR